MLYKSLLQASKQAVAYWWHSPAWLFLVNSPIGTRDHIFVLIFNPYAIRQWASSLVRGLDCQHWLSFYNLGKDRIENTASNSSSVVACVSVAAEACSAWRCLAMTVASGSTIPPFSCHVTIETIVKGLCIREIKPIVTQCKAVLLQDGANVIKHFIS
jgi:hypothetical protein